MIACDTSSLIAFFRNDEGRDVSLITKAIQDGQLFLPPPVLSEILSDPKITSVVADAVADIPLLEILPGFWSRVGKTRARLLAKHYRARLADSLIAQCCIDHHTGLITRDKDFKHFDKLILV